MRPVRDILLEDEELERGFRAQADVPTDELIESVTTPIIEEPKTADNADGHIDETEEVTEALQQDEMAPTVVPQDVDPHMDEIEPDDVPSIEPDTQLADEQEQTIPEIRAEETFDDTIPAISTADLDDFPTYETDSPNEIREDVSPATTTGADSDDSVIDTPEIDQADIETFDPVPETTTEELDVEPEPTLTEPSRDDVQEPDDSSPNRSETFQSFPEPAEPESVEMDDLVEPQSDSSTADSGSIPGITSAGFMGFRDLPSVTESQLEQFESSRGTAEEQIQARIELQMRANEDLASQLAIELEPQFDEIREQQAQTTRDFVQRQIVLNSLMRQG